MSITITPLTSDFAVSPQLSPGDFAEIARLGYRSIINNRPDGEGGPDQPHSSVLSAAAEAAGLAYAFVPVASAATDSEAVEQVRTLLGELPRPILAFCRSGARSTKLYNAASASD
jgi:uncharacterized protein (TIGR01244 family)